jgi:hypothetical protein
MQQTITTIGLDIAKSSRFTELMPLVRWSSAAVEASLRPGVL